MPLTLLKHGVQRKYKGNRYFPVARTSAVIVRHDIEDVLGYYLLGDSSTILYMWTCLVDAMKGFDGRIPALPASNNLEHK